MVEWFVNSCYGDTSFQICTNSLGKQKGHLLPVLLTAIICASGKMLNQSNPFRNFYLFLFSQLCSRSAHVWGRIVYRHGLLKNEVSFQVLWIQKSQCFLELKIYAHLQFKTYDCIVKPNVSPHEESKTSFMARNHYNYKNHTDNF